MWSKCSSRGTWGWWWLCLSSSSPAEIFFTCTASCAEAETTPASQIQETHSEGWECEHPCVLFCQVIDHTGHLNQFHFWVGWVQASVPSFFRSLSTLRCEIRKIYPDQKENPSSWQSCLQQEQHGTDQAYSETFGLHLEFIRIYVFFMRFWKSSC